jgi:tetratricopeptide (TPR) repeat protein
MLGQGDRGHTSAIRSAGLRSGASRHRDYEPAVDSLALVKLRLGKFDEAIALYDRAISRKDSAASYMGRALAYARKGDPVHAQADLAAALTVDPGVEALFAQYGLKLDTAAAAAAAAEHSIGAN